jgi:hypothetical protein
MVRADLLISHDGRHLVKIAPKALTIYTRRPNNFMFEKWADYWGVGMDQVTIIPLLEKDAPPALCPGKLCLIEYTPGRWAAMPLSAAALEAGCARADLDFLITPYMAPADCKAKTVLDRRVFANKGAHLIWLNPYRVLTDYDVRGPQPWNAFGKEATASSPWPRPASDGKNPIRYHTTPKP